MFSNAVAVAALVVTAAALPAAYRPRRKEGKLTKATGKAGLDVTSFGNGVFRGSYAVDTDANGVVQGITNRLHSWRGNNRVLTGRWDGQYRDGQSIGTWTTTSEILASTQPRQVFVQAVHLRSASMTPAVPDDAGDALFSTKAAALFTLFEAGHASPGVFFPTAEAEAALRAECPTDDADAVPPTACDFHDDPERAALDRRLGDGVPVPSGVFFPGMYVLSQCSGSRPEGRVVPGRADNGAFCSLEKAGAGPGLGVCLNGTCAAVSLPVSDRGATAADATDAATDTATDAATGAATDTAVATASAAEAPGAPGALGGGRNRREDKGVDTRSPEWQWDRLGLDADLGAGVALGAGLFFPGELRPTRRDGTLGAGAILDAAGVDLGRGLEEAVVFAPPLQRNGRVKLNADGELDFDADGDFD